MTKIIENINASELPITEIDREAAVVACYDGINPPTTTIHIRAGDETIHVNPAKISIAISDSIAEGIWKAYYMPMYYQMSIVRELVEIIARATNKHDLLKDTPISISYYAGNDTFFIEYLGKEFVVIGDKDKIILKSEVPIPLLESIVFKADNPTKVYHYYRITREIAEFLKLLLANDRVTSPILSVLSIMDSFEERQKFFERYNQLHNKEN